MKSLREYIYGILIRNKKRMALFEIEQDLKYLDKFKGDMIKYDESDARKRMAEIKKKGPEATEIEVAEYEQIEQVLAESKGNKQAYRQTLNLKHDIENYLTIL